MQTETIDTNFVLPSPSSPWSVDDGFSSSIQFTRCLVFIWCLKPSLLFSRVNISEQFEYTHCSITIESTSSHWCIIDFIWFIRINNLLDWFTRRLRKEKSAKVTHRFRSRRAWDLWLICSFDLAVIKWNNKLSLTCVQLTWQFSGQKMWFVALFPPHFSNYSASASKDLFLSRQIQMIFWPALHDEYEWYLWQSEYWPMEIDLSILGVHLSLAKCMTRELCHLSHTNYRNFRSAKCSLLGALLFSFQ